MSMINTKREKIKNSIYIVTDYMYENDNVGINLTTLIGTKTNKVLKIPCIPISYKQNSFASTSSEITVMSKIGIGENGEVEAVFDISYPDKNDMRHIAFDDNEFATDMINTCIIDKKDVKEIPCYKKAFDSMVETIKTEALSNDILIKTPEMVAKCYIYTEDLVLLGTANRLLHHGRTNRDEVYVLGEYCGKNLHDYIDEYGDTTKLVIDVCINKDITLQINNIDLISEAGTTFGYVTVNMDNSKVVRINNIHDSISYKMVPGMILPEYKSGSNESVYYEKYTIGNSPGNIEKFYKLNKMSTNPTININKYLIW